MNEPDPEPPALVRLYHEHRGTIIAVVMAGAGVAMILGFDVQIPRSIQVIGVAALLATPFGFYAGNVVSRLLYSPNWVYIVDLDVREDQNALYRIPSNEYGEIEVQTGEVDRVSPHLVFAQDVDLDGETKTMDGVWRGTATDRELMAELSTVYQIRGQLEKDAQRGFAIESQAWMIVKNATRQATKSVIRTFERGSMPSQEGLEISEAVDEAIESFDFGLVEESSDPASLKELARADPESEPEGGELADAVDD